MSAPDWIRPECQAEYELERAVWVLGKVPLCPEFGVPADVCNRLDALDLFLTSLVRYGVSSEGLCLHEALSRLGEFADGCPHVDPF